MTSSLRTFIAVKIVPGPSLVRLVSHLKQSLHEESVKWAEGNNLHLTLKFLGNTSSRDTEKIKAILNTICSSSPPFQFVLEGVGYFRKNRQPRIIFLNIKKEEALKKLTAGIERQLSPLGFEEETRPFRPHLTLGRIKQIRNLPLFYNTIELFSDKTIQEVMVSEIVFYQSVLTSRGAVYTPLSTHKLQG